MTLLAFVALLFMLVGSAFFAASESAITALSAIRMKRLSLLEPRLRPYFTEWLNQPHRLLTTLMICTNLIQVAISSLAAATAVPLIRFIPERLLGVMVWFATTAALLVFGEMVPKIIGRVYRERISELTLPILSRLSRLLYVFWGPVGWILKRFAPALNTAPVSQLSVLSLEELLHAISETQEAGQMPRESGEMMKRVLSLPHRPSLAILQPASTLDMVPLETFSRGENAANLFVDLLIETGRTRVPVTRNGEPAGYVHVMDVLKSGYVSPSMGFLQSLIRQGIRVASEKGVFELLEDFRGTGEHLAFVHGADGTFRGIVTLEDVLEEIVGEILDEYDLEQKKES